jgi:ABC-type Zn uptake system ZnuABC Zn-binding protein ZnuA
MCLLLTACSRPESFFEENGRPRVVVTTTIIGDLVERVGGDAIQLMTLFPYDADPHDYIFRPADMVAVASADMIIVNGGGLEGQLQRALGQVTHPGRVIDLSMGVPVRHYDGIAGHYHADGSGDCSSTDTDPHFWTDPTIVQLWDKTIAVQLGALLPDQLQTFHQRADLFHAELEELDKWIFDQVVFVPESRRLLVTDHLTLGYFADRYGFTQKGVVIPSFDSMAQPSARHLALLTQALRHYDVPAIFIGETVNPQLVRQLARDTGTEMVTLYSGSLSPADGPAGTYIDYMRHNVAVMVRHLSVAE